MLLWFLGGSFLAVWIVFHDPAIDYRMVGLGALAPDLIDPWFGGAAALHSVTTAVVVLLGVMLATRGRRLLRRRLLAFAFGLFLHLLLDGAFTSTEVFWWPFTGVGWSGEAIPSVARGWWNLLLEAIGLAILVWAYRRFGLADRARRRTFVRTGRLDPALV